VILIKFIRANLLYDFLEENLGETEKIILIRNPFAVIESILNGGQGNWNPPSKDYLIRFYSKILNRDINLNNFIKYNLSNSNRCLLLVRWCLEYQRILSKIDDLDNVFFYE